jgi:hypothetical protein
MRLEEKAAARLLLFRAIEGEDRDQLLLTAEDRRYASDVALASTGGIGGARAHPQQFLAARAEAGLERLTGRYPALARHSDAPRWPAFLNLGLPLLALLLGLSTDMLAGERLNILAFPLLGLVLWNLLAFLLLGWRWLRRRFRARGLSGSWLSRLAELAVRPEARRLAAQPTLERSVTRFARDWSEAAQPLTEARLRRTLHLSAALFALGVIAAMLLRARYVAEYAAGWSGTWAGAEHEIALILSILLGPASWLTGLALPNAAELGAMRGVAQNAGSWLILWSVTALLFVILPRLLLAATSGAEAALLRRRVPVREDFHLRSLVRSALGQPGRARVVPYGVDLPEPARARLAELLGPALGEQVQLRIDPPIPYGEEEGWLAQEAGALASSDYVLLLFALHSTPEAENHGALALGMAGALKGSPATLLVLLDEGGLRRRLGALTSSERRIADRLAAWRTVLAPARLDPVPVRLDLDGPESAEQIERALSLQPVGAAAR